MLQSLERPGDSQQLRISYAIGSGSHAYGFLAQVGDHLFQSPIAFYTSRATWDLAPGYEHTSNPDFSRPVTLQCLTCHSDKPAPVPGTLNSYRSLGSGLSAIQCDRCHGDPDRHLKNPVPGTIVNPAKLYRAARDSICEQCHLAGEVRIPNPGKSVADFQPGERLEDVYTTYILARPADGTVKVISHVEQLALSVCARSSGGKLWCGTCHDPHEKPERPAEYFRARCLACHGATLAAAHAAPDQDCVSCHMPRRPAKDGGHTAFTDHRITRRPEPDLAPVAGDDLVAWREPDASLQQRNLALALVTSGFENSKPDQVIRGFRMLNRMNVANDPEALTAVGTILLKGKQPSEAQARYARALELRPEYAPYEVNLATALLALDQTAEATRHLERALAIDPLLAQAIELLSHVYRLQNQAAKADELLSTYKHAMGAGESRTAVP